jgi:hypothetical protein
LNYSIKKKGIFKNKICEFKKLLLYLKILNNKNYYLIIIKIYIRRYIMLLNKNKDFLNNYFYKVINKEGEREFEEVINYDIIWEVLYEINEEILSEEVKYKINNNKNFNLNKYEIYIKNYLLNNNLNNLTLNNIINNLLINNYYYDE